MQGKTFAGLAVAAALIVVSAVGGAVLESEHSHPAARPAAVTAPAHHAAQHHPVRHPAARPAQAAAPAPSQAPAQAPAPAVQAPAQPVQPAPVTWRNVNPGMAYFIMANSATSDAFAWNVANSVQSNGYGVQEVYSPVTAQTYTMNAYPVTGPDGGTAVMVTGGNGAAVELYVTTLSGDQPPAMP
jgi:hypothetical protein